MAQFASSDDFAAYIGVTLTGAEVTRADALLTLASGLIQDETNQVIALVPGDTYTRPGDYDERIRLPQRPVVSVASASIAGVELELGTNFYLDGDELVRLNWNAVVQDSSFGLPWAGWGFPWQDIVVVYTHGYADDSIPGVAKTTCMEMATRKWVNPGSVARETIGNTQTVFDNMRFSPSGLLMTDTERDAVNEAIRRHTTTTSLR